MTVRARDCECGCGGTTRGGRFIPGHDAKLKSRLLKDMANGDTAAMEELERRGWLGIDNRQFGIEIEFFGCTPQDLIDQMAARGLMCSYRGYTHQIMTSWKIVTDASVTSTDTGVGRGLELVSPILKGKNGRDQLKAACEALAAAGARVDKSCGIHVHHDANDMKLEQIKRAVRIYKDSQQVINQFVPKSRRDGNEYCRAWSEYDIAKLEQASDLRQISNLVDRYRTINLNSYGKYGTIEIRQHGGSTEYHKIINWVVFGQALIAAAKLNKTVDSTSVNGLLKSLKLTENQRQYLRDRAQRLAA